mmetsp:Transcript_73290/g.166119  ORF Transcript_73290/g.166119 Transcript_73290/m.166119 type:complete len:284 (-) Transcript_73290:374-1225(-)
MGRNIPRAWGCRSSRVRLLGGVDALHEGRRPLHGMGGQHAVAEVGDVPVDAELLGHALGSLTHQGRIAVQHERVQVALEGLVRALAARLLRRGRPAHADDVVVAVVEHPDLAVLREDGHEGIGPAALHLGGNVLQVRDAEILVDVRRDFPAVRVEDGQQRSAGVVLPHEILDDDVPQGPEELARILGVEVEPLLGVGKVANSPAFHHVAHEGPGSAAEANDGHLVLDPGPRPVDRVEDVTQGLRNIGLEVQLGDVLGGLNGELKLRASLRHHVASHAHGHWDD